MRTYKEHGDIDQEIWCNFEQEIGQDKQTRYFVEWDITEDIDQVIKNKLKDELQIDEDNYFTMDCMEGFCTSDRKEALKFYSDLSSIIDEQLNLWKEGRMTDYEKIEWVHSQISELRDGVEVDLETMQYFIEDIREIFIKKEEIS